MAEETDPKKLVEVLLKTMSPEQAGKAIQAFIKLIVESAVMESVPPIFEKAMNKAGYSDEAAGLVHMLAAKGNDTKEETLLKALTLYGLALDAREKGNRLAILNPSDEIIHDVIGFESDMNEIPVSS
jgi:hypothetical protein